MNSQQASGNPNRKPTNFKRHNFNNGIKCRKVTPKALVCIVLVIVILALSISVTYGIERSIYTGFKTDSMNSQTVYSSSNNLFSKYGNMANITINVHGVNTYTVSSPIISVKEIIEKLSLTVGTNDVISVPENSMISDNMTIGIDEVIEQTHIETTDIPFTTRTLENPELESGTERIVQAGENGYITYSVVETFKNGVSVDKISTQIDKGNPTEEIKEIGTKTVYNSDSSISYKASTGSTGSEKSEVFTDSTGKSYEYSYYIDVTATAYGTLSGKTATGKEVDYGMIAVDPSVVPLGTKVYLTGSWGDMGVCTAEDTGSAIKGNRIDVFLGDDEALLNEFGRRSMRIYILK